MRRLLLAGVFKPYGVTDEYGEALCTMELLNNQVTREQGIHSPRTNNYSFGLYLMAENVEVPTTVLDFPSWEEFAKEVRKGNYSHIGISFIVPNILKAKRMASYIRAYSPGTKIILGGHGTSIPNIQDIIEYDEICRGEGVTWLRRYFGEDPTKEIIHPVVYSAVRKFVYGAPILSRAAIIISGVGCQNSCRFCATTHKFEKQYTGFLGTGKQVFDACEKSEKALRTSEFMIMDENFCKMPKRARQMLVEMEKHNKAYTFSTFSSAETIYQLGIDFLVRAGIKFLWIGVESKANVFDKTKGIDLHALIADLQNHGITVLASAILFMEHHDKQTIQEDIDWAISLESDLLQFMEFGPIPGTKLYKDYDEQGKLIKDISWHKQHGQDEIWFHHPHFTLPETSAITKQAFIKSYHENGAGVVNMAYTYVKGYITAKREMEEREKLGLVWDAELLRYVKSENPKPDEYMKLRLEEIRISAVEFRPIFNAAIKYAPNQKMAEKARMVKELFDKAFGPPTIGERVFTSLVSILAVIEKFRAGKSGSVMRQPFTNRVTYPDRTNIAHAHHTHKAAHHREHVRHHSSDVGVGR